MDVKSIKDGLCREFPYRVELHAHTKPVSGCSVLSPEEFVDLFIENGYDGAALTNHFTMQAPDTSSVTAEQYLDYYLGYGYDRVKEYADKKGFKVYLGAELRFFDSGRDYLIYGVDRDILLKCYDGLYKGLDVMRQENEFPDSVIIQAHPYRGEEPYAPEFLDGVECFNVHPGHNSRVGLSAKFAKETNLKCNIVGADVHEPYMAGLAAVRFRRLPEDTFDLAKIIKSGDYCCEIGNAIILM